MYLFVKLWTPKPSWEDLPQEKRISFIKKAQEMMQSVSERGLETVGWIEIDSDSTIHNSGYQYCSVYKTPSKESANEFNVSMQKFGWYDYFDQINATGQLQSPGAVLAKVVSS